MAIGIRSVWSDAEVRQVPIADGGEGTVEALVAAGNGYLLTQTVHGPFGESVDATFALIDDGCTAVVELAAAAGLPLVHKTRGDPRIASSYGFGELLEAARRKGVSRIIAAIGGSATNDGGAGMAQALGYRLLDSEGHDLPAGGAALASLQRIDASQVDPGWREIRVDVACDVVNPLTGPNGASVVYGPQKGATPEMVVELDAALVRFAEVIERDLRVAVADLPGAGAAGGAGAGLVAFLSAKLVRGAPLVLDAAGLNQALQGAHAVLTGEGRVDRQTAYGKGPAEVIARARAAGLPVILIAGRLGEGWDELDVPVVVIGDGERDVEELMEEPSKWIAAAAARACHDLLVQRTEPLDEG
jgi:glycerate 2-kinase